MSLWRAPGPAVPRPGAPETVKAALGAGLGLLVADLLLQGIAPHPAPVLPVAPFGASAFVIHAVPSSPLAQPWPVVVGNTVSALAGLLALMLPLPGLAQACLAVALAGISDPALTAAALARPVATLPPDAPVEDLVLALADGGQEAVPILDRGHLAGIVTRSDPIAALLHDLGPR